MDPLKQVDRPAVLALISRHLTDAWASFDRPRPAEPTLSPALVRRLATGLPDDPGSPEDALTDAADVLDASVSPARPLFAAYIGSTGLEAGVIAGTLAAAYDVNMASSAGAAELLERQALEWMAQFIGYPSRDGAFTSGGMTSNLTALLAAREHALPDVRRSGVGGRAGAVYCSEEAHHSIVRAAEVAGLGTDAVRRIPLDGERRMRTDRLTAAILADLRDGVTPIAVVATAGTTLTGAIDPLSEIAQVCERTGVWMHVDGAYGAPAAAVPSSAWRFAGLECADSVTVDAHKWMGVQKSCSLVLLRRAGALRQTFTHSEKYMLHAQESANPVDSTLEYSRPVRSLKLWLAFRVYGAAAFRDWIGGSIAHARDLADKVTADPDLELLHEPTLSTVCFRHLGGGDLDAHNQMLAATMQRDGRVYLAPALLDGKVCLRACFANFRTQPEHVDELLRVVKQLAGRVPVI